MIVYLETNFILELAFGRAEAPACRQLLDWCGEQRLQLRFPAYALTEARSALRRREKDRVGVVQDLRRHETELSRLYGSEDLAASCHDAARAISTSMQNERIALSGVLSQLSDAASFIPLDHEVVRLAEVLSESRVLSGEGDLWIFASVVRDLRERDRASAGESSLLATRDTDFGPNVSEWLHPFSCDLINSYDAAVGRLKENFA